MNLRMPLPRRYELRRRAASLGTAPLVATRAPFVRESLSVRVALLLIVGATLPAWAAGAWFTGVHLLEATGPDGTASTSANRITTAVLSIVLGPPHAARLTARPHP